VLITYLCYLRSSNDNILIFLYKFLHHSWLKRCNEHILPWKPYLERFILDVLDCNCTNESAMFSCFCKQPSIALLFFYFAIHVTWHLLMFCTCFLRHWRHVAVRCSWPLFFTCEWKYLLAVYDCEQMTMSFSETVIYHHVVQVELLDVVVFLCE